MNEFQQKIYKYLKSTLSKSITEGDLDIFVKLISYIFGDLYERAKKLPWEIDVDNVDEEYLRSLSSIIGYKWNNSLTADQQRESIKIYLLIRKYRGTKFGLMNLIRVFGQEATTYYSTADLRGIEIVEYDEHIPEQSEPNMYPGDIKIRIPELSQILRDAMSDTQPIGTRITFVYYIFLGMFHMNIVPGVWYKINKHIRPTWVERSNIIETYGDYGLDESKGEMRLGLNTILGRLYEWQITHRTRAGEILASSQILTYHKDAWTDGWILAEPGLTNYRGFIEEDGVVEEDKVLYE